MKKAMALAVAAGFILAAGAVAAEFSADVITEMAGNQNRGKVYFKNPDVFRNEMMGMVNIIKRPKAYQFIGSTKKYYVTDLNDAANQNPMADARDFKEWIDKNKLEKVGSETIQGYACDIYEGDVVLDEGQPPVRMKTWYSEKLDYPVKTESEMPAPMGRMSTYLENIKPGPQPDGLFDILPGYEKVGSAQEAMGLGGMTMPGAQGDAEMPSAEDMEKMRRQMEEMMKQQQKQ